MILALDAAGDGCLAAAVVGGAVLASRHADGTRGNLATLPAMAQAVLQAAALQEPGRPLRMVAVTIGPGSFTGIRAAISLAHGIALAAGVPAVGVTVGEALDELLPGRAHWTASDSRRGRVFLDRAGLVEAVTLDALPEPPGPIALSGDAAAAVAKRLTERGADVLLRDAPWPDGPGIAAAALRRVAAGPDARPVQPLYVDPPGAKPPG